ncbi:MAG: tRNA (N6-isopentenyl adenosine(37)-C2)-methylthiotransferase MiaB [Pseudomonadota bacterium]
MKMKKVYIKTFGCQMNDLDSERMFQILAKDDYVLCGRPSEADLVLLNTCSIREKAAHKAFSFLGRAKQIKEDRKDLIIGFAGCVAQEEGKQVIEKYPYVNFVLGTHQLHRLSEIVAKHEKASKKTVILEMKADEFSFSKFNPIERTAKTSEMISIMHGCNNYCSYCIVPYVRGLEISRNSNEIVEEVKKMVSLGTREVTLLGQNVNSYRSSENGSITRFPELISLISEIDGLLRIRFVTSHPKDISDELISLFSTNNKLASAIHLPVQSGSDRILELMNRKYKSADYFKIIDKLRANRPDIAITTDIIVAFPGETDEDFQATCDLLKQVRFDNIFSFVYSPRKNTKAFGFKDELDLGKKKQRLEKIHNIQDEITNEVDRKYLKKTVEVLVENTSKLNKEELTGRTDTNKIVNFAGNKELIGQVIKCEITQVNNHSLFGKALDPETSSG